MVEGRQGAINEIENTGLARAWCVIGGNDLRGQGIDFRGLLRREKFQLGRLPGLGHFVGVILRG
jgi:hypothetical protein